MCAIAPPPSWTAQTWSTGSSAANSANQQPIRTEAIRRGMENRRIERETMGTSARTAEPRQQKTDAPGRVRCDFDGELSIAEGSDSEYLAAN